MTFTFEHDGDAYLSVLAVVIGADQVGSLGERDFLFREVMVLPVFGSPSRAEFSGRLARVTDDVYAKLPCEDGMPTSEGVDALLADVREALGADHRKTLVQVAEQLCAADGLDDREAALLARIRGALLDA
jgi:hypothetical protein